ncbi:hypothetical protein V5O48_011950 [Marasmius crinis-equi]|uniref:NAD(P)-binding protein n=2 Tax=Marasmius crinis-equi TaxID=585013 RepID=A0ABR3F4M3_9AGAR
MTFYWLLALLPLPLLFKLKRRPKRYIQDERVLILGGSSGIGLEIAKAYISRGARVCIVGRSQEKLDEATRRLQGKMRACKVDTGNVEDMVRLKGVIEEEWHGLDTLILTVGVSSTRPLLSISQDPRRTLEVTNLALQSNYISPLLAALTFVPTLESTSSSPSILQISSLAAVIPAPTRSLYASTKGAALLLYQSLAIEHPKIRWSFVLPSTVKGGFRGSAVDGSASSSDSPPNTASQEAKEGLSPTYVASRCIQAIDNSEKVVFIPSLVPRLGHLLYWLWPSFVERKAAKKYGFTTQSKS